MSWLTEHYLAYLEAQKTDGGTCSEWVTTALADAMKNPAKSGWDKARAEMFTQTARGLWDNEPEPEQFDLFTVVGIKIEPTYAFRDPLDEHTYRRVVARWATARHATADAIIAREKADESVLAAVRKANAAAELMARAGGDPDALLWDLRELKAA
jgi:hypothetical protein